MIQLIKGFLFRHPAIATALKALIALCVAAVLGDLFGADALLSEGLKLLP